MANWNGQPRKMLVQGTRNGYFFVLDRTNGKNLVTKPLVVEYVKWSMGINAKGQPIPNPEKDPSIDGVLVGPGDRPPTGRLRVSARRPASSMWALPKAQHGLSHRYR